MIMFKKIVTKLVLAATLACTTGTIAMSAAACNVETDHPTVKITVEVRPDTQYSSTYELEYTLYRNMYPNTVRHFIELADSGFYNNMIVHDYQAADWLSGGYKYDAASYSSGATSGTLSDYFNNEDISKANDYISLFESGALTPSVYDSANPDVAWPTLVGEFSSNRSPEIKQGQFSAEAGVLKMYYYTKNTKERVLVKFNDGTKYTRQYMYNCATSIFAMQVAGGTNISGANYCAFGRISNGNTLNKLVEATSDINSTSTISNIFVDNWDTYSPDRGDQSISVSFKQPSEPIIIKSVKVTKY